MCIARRSFNQEVVICAPSSPMSCGSVHILHGAARITCHGSRRKIVAHETWISLVVLLPIHLRQEQLRISNRRSPNWPRLHSSCPHRPHLAAQHS